MIRFELPSLGADMDEGTLVVWHVKPGDVVKRGQVVAVVDTSKAAVDVEIWQPGTVQALHVEPGQKIPVGTLMMTLTGPGETGSRPDVAASPSTVAATPAARPAATPAATAAEPLAAVESMADARDAVPTPSATSPHAASVQALIAAARHPVSPAARKRARELDVDPAAVTGTGPHGSVTIADIERAAAERAASTAAVTPAATSTGADLAPAAPARTGPPAAPLTLPVPATTIDSDARVAAAGTAATTPVDASARQDAMRAAIAAAMSRSKREIPHYYLAETIPMATALAWLQQRNAAVPITDRMLPAVLQIKAVARALRSVPELNGFYRDGRFVRSDAVHAGIAISLRGGGLVAPAIHDVEHKPLALLMRELSDLVRRARAGSLRSSEMSDPTITITNLGDQGAESVFPVIYPPQVAIVGFGRVTERPWAQDGWLRAVPLVTATLAADHRVSDGHRGARFLVELGAQLQHPQALDDNEGAPTDADRPPNPA